MQKLLTPSNIADLLQVSLRQAQRHIQDMNPTNVGTGTKRKKLRVKPEEFDAWMRRRIVTPEVIPANLPRQRARKHYPTDGLVNGKIPYETRRTSKPAEGG